MTDDPAKPSTGSEPDFEAAVRAARERYAPATVDMLPILFFIILADGRLVHANATLGRVLGRTPDQLLGSRAEDLLSLEDPSEVTRRLGDALHGGATTGEVRLALPDGGQQPVLLSVHRIDLGGQPTLVGTGVDLAPRIEAERRASAYEALVRAAFEASPDAVVVVGDRDDVAVANQRFDEVFPTSRTGLASSFVDRIVARAADPVGTREQVRALAASDARTHGGRVRLRDGRTFEHSSEPFTSGDGTTARVVHFRDVTEVVAAEEHLEALNARLGRRVDEQWAELRAATDRLEHMAFHDPLTGLPNRRHLYDEVNARLVELARAADAENGPQAGPGEDGVTEGGPFDLVYIDLDGFKSVNDRFGHDAGDQVLRVQSDRMQRAVEGIGWASRLAGDEFVLIVDRTPAEGLDRLLSQMTAALKEPIPVGGHDLIVSASIGVARGRAGVADAEALLNEADAHMYDAKRSLMRRRDDRQRDDRQRD